MTRRARFTLVHGFVVSLALHSAVAVPFVARRLVPRPDDPPVLVIDLQSIVEDEQTERKVLEQVKGTTDPEKIVEKPKPIQDEPPEPPPEKQQDATEEPIVTVPSPPPQAASPGKDKQNVVGTDQNQTARTVKTEQQDDDELSDYVKVLSKKVRDNLVFPANGRPASAVVAFTILADGKLRPDSLKIAESSGQPRLDASALQTIRASAPFPRPPKELSVAIIVDFERKH
jgi:protein TonB